MQGLIKKLTDIFKNKSLIKNHLQIIITWHINPL